MIQRLQLVALGLLLSATGFAQKVENRDMKMAAPNYDFRIDFAALDGNGDYLYDISLVPSAASPAAPYSFPEITAVFAVPTGMYETGALPFTAGGSLTDFIDEVASDSYNATPPSNYDNTNLISAAEFLNFGVDTQGNDIISIVFLDNNVDRENITHGASNFPVIRIRLTPAATINDNFDDPVLLRPSDPLYAQLNPFGFGNSVLVDEDGVGGNGSTQQYAEQITLSNGADLEAISFTASPNPTTGPLSIYNPSAQQYEYSVMNMLGQDLGINGTLEASGTTELNLSSLETAVYFVNITDGSQSTTIRIIRNK